MKKRVWLAGGLAWVGVTLLLIGTLETSVRGQDLTTLLTMFLRNLAAGVWVIGGTDPTAAGADTQMVKTVTGIADATATTVLTVTIPNASNTALLRVDATGMLGAGGAVGAYESACSGTFIVVFTRVTGVTVATGGSSLAQSTGSIAVTGGATCTLARSLNTDTSTAGAANVVAVKLTITKGSGSSDNHRARLFARLQNTLGGSAAMTVQ